ncbi:phage head morphogenesis protein [Serratia fonticola]
MSDSVTYWLSANYKSSGAAMAMDASPAMLMRSAMRKLTSRWVKRFDDIAEQIAKRFATGVMANTDITLTSALSAVNISVPFTMTSEMNNALQAVIGENVGLIRSIPQQYLSQVETLVMQSVSRGRDLSTLTDELQERYGITRRRAAFIALDQNNKATSVMQAARQRSLGFKRGIWRHSNAAKVPRKSHVKANGKEFDLDKGMLIDGEWIMPGEKPRCGCGWQAVIPTFDANNTE